MKSSRVTRCADVDAQSNITQGKVNNLSGHVVCRLVRLIRVELSWVVESVDYEIASRWLDAQRILEKIACTTRPKDESTARNKSDR
jgi:hypothetical protein